VEMSKNRQRDPASVKPGDWRCPQCNVNNFARRDSCYRCQASKPSEGRGGRGRSRSPRRDRRDRDRDYDDRPRRGYDDRDDRRDDDRGRDRDDDRGRDYGRSERRRSRSR